MSELQSDWWQGKPDTRRPGHCWVGRMPRRGVGTIVPVSQVRRTWIAVTRPLEPGFQGPTLFALYPPAPPSPHPTPVNSWEVTVTFAEGQLGKGGGPSLLFLSPRGI